MSDLHEGAFMIPVDQVIAAYEKAIEDDDRVRSSRLLESLEDDAYGNEADWEIIRDFCEKRNFDARLEIITKGLIRKGQPLSGKPFLVLASLLVKSGRLAEARPLLELYKQNRTDSGSDKWEFVSLLLKLEFFEECLDEVRKAIKENPTDVPYLITEASALWKSKEDKAARQKLRELVPFLGNKSGNWLWYSALARELNEPDIARGAVSKLVKMLEAGTAKLSGDAIYALKNTGHEADLRDIIFAANPKNYSGISEYVEMFEAAISCGARKTALKFAEAILSFDENHKLRPKIEQLTVSPGFLMS